MAKGDSFLPHYRCSIPLNIVEHYDTWIVINMVYLGGYLDVTKTTIQAQGTS